MSIHLLELYKKCNFIKYALTEDAAYPEKIPVILDSVLETKEYAEIYVREKREALIAIRRNITDVEEILEKVTKKYNHYQKHYNYIISESAVIFMEYVKSVKSALKDAESEIKKTQAALEKLNSFYKKTDSELSQGEVIYNDLKQWEAELKEKLARIENGAIVIEFPSKKM